LGLYASYLDATGNGGQVVDFAGLAMEEEKAAVKCLDKRVTLAVAPAVVVSGIPVVVGVGVRSTYRPNWSSLSGNPQQRQRTSARRPLKGYWLSNERHRKGR
jgi:hypothetical protein